MLVLASTVVTVLIVVAIVAGIGLLFVALGPLSSREQERDDLGSEMGPLGTARLDQEETRAEVEGEEVERDEGWSGPDAEERLDQQNE